MIVALDSPIMNLLLENSDKVPAGIPIVFGGCETITPDIKQKYPNITGVIQQDDAEGTLRAGLALYPDTRTVMVLSDDSPESRKFEQDFKARVPSIKGVDFIFINNSDSTLDEIHRKIAELPESSLLMLSPWRGLDGNDYQSLAAEFQQETCPDSPAAHSGSGNPRPRSYRIYPFGPWKGSEAAFSRSPATRRPASYQKPRW